MEITFVDKLMRIGQADEGATAVIVAIMLLVLFGAALIAIDVGSLWISRRSVISGTDAAVLGVGSYFAQNRTSACTSSGRKTARSHAEKLMSPSGAVITEFTVDSGNCTSNLGQVEIEAKIAASSFFAGIFGRSPVDAEARTRAEWGPLTGVQSVRPVALCQGEPAVQEWVTLRDTLIYSNLRGVDYPFTPHFDHPGANVYPGADVVHRIPTRGSTSCWGDDDDDDDKDGRNARVGWIDFNGSRSPNGSSAVREWLRDGFDEIVTLGSSSRGDEDCQPSVSGNNDCEGIRSSLKIESALDDISCSPATETAECQMFPVILYDEAEKRRGQNQMHLSGFLGVVLRGFDDKGRDDDDDDDEKSGHLDLEFVSLQWDGIIGSHGVSAGVHGVQICEVDHDVRRC